MERRSWRKRKECPPVLSTAALAKRAALEVLQGAHGGSARAAAAHYNIPCHSHVQYYVNKWEDTEVGSLLLASPMAVAGVASVAEVASPMADSPPPVSLLPEIPDEEKSKSKSGTKTWIAKQAGLLVQRGECSVRAALEMTNLKYAEVGVGAVSYGTVFKYSKEGFEEPLAAGRPAHLPQEFCDRLVSWIRAKRALKFPVFRDEVLAMANYMIEGTELAQQFKHQMVDVNWYYRPLRKYAHVLSTANQRPLEIDRARWATAMNILDWYKMLATALVCAGVAKWNPDFVEGNDPDSRAGQPIIITHPERIFSFDESRVELDMTKASKAKQERTIVDITVPREERGETLAAKGGLNGTGVGGSTADGKALPALFIFSGGGLSPAMCKPIPNCDFYDEDGKMLGARFTANKKGGVIGDVGVQYIRDVVLPAFPDTCEEFPLVGICDGHGSHLTLALLDFCRDNHVRIVLRVPHCSHLIQGEDVRNFSS
jgi:hypothetical protein